MIKRLYILLLFVLALPVSVTPILGQNADALIQPDNLVYLGAFRLPDEPIDGWAYSGAALAYYPDGDPGGAVDGFPGSLFATGHNWYQHVAELSIPAPVISPDKDITTLNMATTLQPLTDIRGDLYENVYLEQPRAALATLPVQGNQDSSKLYFAWAAHAGEMDTLPTHGWTDLHLSSASSVGTWYIGETRNYVTGNYLFDIPADWAAQHTPGQLLATGRYRDGGQVAQGPSLFAIAPWEAGNPPPAGAVIPATPLLRYGSGYDENAPTMDGYHHSDEWSGAAWLTAGERSAVIFVGTKGLGENWYGCSDGTVWEEPYPDDCEDHNRGWWSTDFEDQIIFYNPADFAAVAAGEMAPYEPQPYAVLNMEPFLYLTDTAPILFHAGAASFDRANSLLYVMQPFADGDKPIVHVWQIQ